jgi:chromosome partitioning protein
MAEGSSASEIIAALEEPDARLSPQAEVVGIEALSQMTDVAQGIMSLVRKRALAPSLEKSPRRYSMTEVAELMRIPRKTLDYYIRTKGLPQGEIDNRKRLFTLADIEAFRKHTGALPWRGVGTKPAIITVANNKGGVGKTSCAIHAAQYFARRSYRVLIVDLDPQASLTTVFGYLPDSDIPDEATTLPFFRGETDSLSGAIRKTHWHLLDLIPANLGLSDAEFSLASRAGREIGFVFYQPLLSGLEKVGENYDVIILDTPPAQGFITLNALFAATGLLIPLTPVMMDFASVGTFLRLLTTNLEVINRYEGQEKSFDFVRIALSKFEGSNKIHQQIERWVRQGFSGSVLSNNLALSAALRTGPDLLTAYEASFENAKRTLDRRTLHRAIEFLDSVNEELEDLIRARWAAQQLAANVGAGELA